MSNVVPQKPSLNRIIWRELEEKISSEYLKKFIELWIITGPIYYKTSPDRFLESGIRIPDAFFKIIFDLDEKKAGKYRVLGFLVEQDDQYDPSFKSYLTSIDNLEDLTGFDFFSELEDQVEEALESRFPKKIW